MINGRSIFSKIAYAGAHVFSCERLRCFAEYLGINKIQRVHLLCSFMSEIIFYKVISLNGAEGGDSCGTSGSMETPEVRV